MNSSAKVTGCDDIGIKRLRFVKHTADWQACDEAADLIKSMAKRLTQQRDENERDARRYQYILDCEVCAVKAFLPDIDPDAYREKVRAKHDAELAALAAQQGGDDE